MKNDAIDVIQAHGKNDNDTEWQEDSGNQGVGAPHIRDRLYWMADTHHAGLEGRERAGKRADAQLQAAERNGATGGLADTNSDGCESRDGIRLHGEKHDVEHGGSAGVERPGPTNGFWRDADWLGCRDGKWRPVSPKPQPLVDGSAESLGRVRPKTIAKIEEEINAWSMESQIDRDTALRDLLDHFGTQSHNCWQAGRIPELREAPFLLAFLRQLAQQGWGVAQCLPLSCEEIAQASLRGMRRDGQPAGAPRQYGLEEQQSGEYSDVVPFLSSLLARHALEEWDDAYAAHAEIGFPLAHNARSRVARLGAYGNAICAPAAQAFIESVMESSE